MAERRAPGFNIPIDFYDGAEVNSISKRIRAAAIGVWALAGNYSATKLLDGYVGPEMLKMFGCTPAIRAALQSTINNRGELSPLWVDARSGGVQLTNWPKWQRTNDEVTAYRQSEADRKRAARKAKGNSKTSGNGETSGRTTAGRPQDVPPDHRDPKTETETETKTESFPVVTSGGGVTSADAHEPRPHCPEHAENHDGPCKRCERRRKWDEQHEADVQRDELERKRRLREIAANCEHCHGTNVIEVGNNAVRKCDHGQEPDDA